MRTNRSARLAFLSVIATLGVAMIGWAIASGPTFFGAAPAWLAPAVLAAGLVILVVAVGFLAREIFREDEEGKIAFDVEGDDNVLENNIAVGYDRGFRVRGNRLRLLWNRAFGKGPKRGDGGR